MRCRQDFAARGRRRREQKDPRLAADIRAIVAPPSHADPELKSPRRSSHLTAAEVREARITTGPVRQELPSERTRRDIRKRIGDRLQRIPTGKPRKKTPPTDAIVAHGNRVRDQAQTEPETLEIARDAQAQVALGEYSRGGKNPDRRRR